MKGKEYLIKSIQDADNNEIIRIANCLNICANEFFPKTHSYMCGFSETHDISECDRCWKYALEVDQG
jgi:hypothetical protein